MRREKEKSKMCDGDDDDGSDDGAFSPVLED